MKYDKPLFFTGIDWGSASLQACLIDRDGAFISDKSLLVTAAGVFANWPSGYSTSPAQAPRTSRSQLRPHAAQSWKLFWNSALWFTPSIQSGWTASETTSPPREPRMTAETQGRLPMRFVPTAATCVDSGPRTPTSPYCTNSRIQDAKS